MTTYSELLPVRKSSKHSGIRWVPNDTTNVPDDRLPVAGTLTIDTDRSRVVYAVCEFPTPWDGRGFYLEKLSVAGDPAETSYSVFVARNRQDLRCECRGFQRHGHCKHCDAVLALIENGWI